MIKIEKIVLDYRNKLIEVGYNISKIEFEKPDDDVANYYNITCNEYNKDDLKVQLVNDSGKIFYNGITPIGYTKRIRKNCTYTGLSQQGLRETDIKKVYTDCVELQLDVYAYVNLKTEEEVEKFNEEIFREEEKTLLFTDRVRLEDSKDLLKVSKEFFESF